MNKVNVYFLSFLSVILLVKSSSASAQTDSLRLTFNEVERRFLENNLVLVARKYNIDASKALIKQVALWDNPTLNTEQNLYDNTRRFFNHSDGNGEVYAVLTQVFKTAGKRGRQIQLAKDEVSLQEAGFNGLMRNLKYNLQQDFYDAASLQEKNRLYSSEINSLKLLADAIDKSFKVGNSSFKEAVRVKALLFGLQTDMLEINRQLVELQGDMKTLLSLKETTTIIPVTDVTGPTVLPEVDDLVAKALVSRPDYLTVGIEGLKAKDNLAYQRSLAMPDISAGIVYDRVNSYAPHYFGLQIGLPLPLFDHNQGNIKAAMLDLKNQEYLAKAAEINLKNEVKVAAEKYKICCKAFIADSGEFYNKYDLLYKGMLKSYQQRQISLIEFIDFFDSYKETELKIIDQRYHLLKAAADLNYVVGTRVVNP